MDDHIAQGDGRALPEVSPYLAEILRDEWLWRSMGGEMILVTAHGGARVVIAANPNRASKAACIMAPTEQEGGAHVLRPITPDHPIAKVLAALPDMLRALRMLADRTLEYVGPPPRDPKLAASLDCDADMRAKATAALDALAKAGLA